MNRALTQGSWRRRDLGEPGRVNPPETQGSQHRAWPYAAQRTADALEDVHGGGKCEECGPLFNEESKIVLLSKLLPSPFSSSLSSPGPPPPARGSGAKVLPSARRWEVRRFCPKILSH